MKRCKKLNLHFFLFCGFSFYNIKNCFKAKRRDNFDLVKCSILKINNDHINNRQRNNNLNEFNSVKVGLIRIMNE